MENDAATLYCPNEICQAANPLTHKFCQRCSTPLPKRFLWAVADGLELGKPGEILAARYLVIDKSILLDTKPGLVPQAPDSENLQIIRPYLRLIPYRLHVPQVYGVLPVGDERSSHQEILLLEKPPLKIIDNTNTLSAKLGSDLTTAWRDATSLRQLNWLWQIAQLWQPLASEGVVSSFFDTQVLRTEGPLVRLLELRSDHDFTPDLSQLGEVWQKRLLPTAKPAIADFLNQICHSLIQAEILSAEQLIRVLDQGLAEVGRTSSKGTAQKQVTTVTIATKSDTGPSRQRNEDACYPPSGSTISKPPQATALAIVCDGIGGHEGGNVASNLAIETIQHQVQEITKLPYDHVDSAVLLEDLQRAAAIANDKISQRNDSESRQGRQRMGTTLVMALPVGHEMYIAHVGDSRAYWINRQGCYQVTLDDDVASREVRLGYAIYRDAVQQGASGSLVQALGMSPSSSLHPSAERFILDEDCIFLLCSDGLSDFDRVDQYWDTEILPILTEKKDISKVVDKLVEIANTLNGHDNVTIALVHYQIKYSEPESKLPAVLPEISANGTANHPHNKTLQLSQERGRNQKTRVIPDTLPSKRSLVPLQLVILLILVLGGALLGYLWGQQAGPFKAKAPESTPTAGNNTAINNPPPATTPTSEPVGDNRPVIIIPKQLSLSGAAPPSKPAIVPANSVLKILNDIKEEPNTQQANQISWVYLRVCSVGKGANSSGDPSKNQSTPTPGNTANNKAVVKPGEAVRMPLSQFQELSKVSKLTQESAGQCPETNVATPNQSPVDSNPGVAPVEKVSPQRGTKPTDN